MDRNGYNESIMPSKGCYWCGRTDGKMDRHEVFHGAFRKKAKAAGLWVLLCHDCHAELHQHNAMMDHLLKCAGQRAAMEHYGWSIPDFIREFGKNRLEGCEDGNR